MTAYNAKHPYEPDWQIPRGVWANEMQILMRSAIYSYGELELGGMVQGELGAAEIILKGSFSM